MHGEYKQIGGKLVVVDFIVKDDAIRQVSLAGDFFLYPDDILSRWREALEGAPAASTREELMERLREALAEGDELFGVDEEAVATAIGRGLGR